MADPSLGYFIRRYAGSMHGVSVIELLMTLAVAAILMGVGAPGLSHYIKNNRLSESSFDMLGTINLARSEAVKRRVRVVLCRSADPKAATPTCGGSDNNWSTGWLIFASGDANNTYDAGTDTLLRVGVLHSKGITITSNGPSNNNIEYNSDGTTNEGGSTAAFAFCDNRGGAFGRRIEVPPHGRPRFVKGSATSPIDCTSPS